MFSNNRIRKRESGFKFQYLCFYIELQYDTHLTYIIEKHLQNVADVTTIFQIFIKVLKEVKFIDY